MAIATVLARQLLQSGVKLVALEYGGEGYLRGGDKRSACVREALLFYAPLAPLSLALIGGSLQVTSYFPNSQHMA